MDYSALFLRWKETALHGRYITNTHIQPLLAAFENENVKIIGRSEAGKNIYAVQFGIGKTKVLMWSQMHGNESTATKALFDLCNFLTEAAEAATILKNCTLLF